MKKLLTLSLIGFFPFMLSAQKVLKYHFKNKKEYILQKDQWDKPSLADARFVINFKNNTVEKIVDGLDSKIFSITRTIEGTDNETLEDCQLIQLEGGAYRIVLYKREERGLRFIQKEGPIVAYYNSGK